MHFEILSEQQKLLLPHLQQFKRNFYLVWGTAVALYIGHRQSIDFELFTYNSSLNKSALKQKIAKIPFPKIPIYEDTDQLHLNINEIKTTFFAYPYQVLHSNKVENYLTMPTLLELAAMKAFALGRRAKWKDYVDLYFIIKKFFSLNEILEKAYQIYGKELFSEKLFCAQLSYHNDINYNEEIEFINGCAIDKQEVKDFLIEKAISFLNN